MKTRSKKMLGRGIACGVLMLGVVGMSALALGQMGSSRYSSRTTGSRTASYRSPSNDAELNDQYGVLLERNMFVADRRKAPPPVTRPSVTRTLAPEQTMVLTGIVLEDGQLRAYVEDRARGRVQKLVIGDAIASGRVSDIRIDAIAYENASGKTWVGIGKTLSGTQFSSDTLISNMAEAGVGAPTTGPAAGGDSSLNTGGLSIEEQMKLRRERLMQGGQK